MPDCDSVPNAGAKASAGQAASARVSPLHSNGRARLESVVNEQALKSLQFMAPCRVLHVEDNPAELDLAVEMLDAYHPGEFELISVFKLEDARKVCARTRFDCIVLDLQLPDATGVEAIEALRQQNVDAAILVYSGRDDDATRSAAFRAGAQEFVRKNSPTSNSLSQSILFALEKWRTRKLHAQIEGLVAANPDAMIVTDDAGVVCFVNRAACDLFDREEDEFIGERMDFAIVEGQTTPIDIYRRNQRRAGEMRVVACAWNGRSALLAAIRDVTEQKALAEHVRRVQNTQAIGQFAGGMAHDLGNTLTCASVLIESVRARLAEDDPARLDLKEAMHALESGHGLVRQLLNIAKSREWTPRRLDLNGVLSELESFLRRTLPANISVEVERSEGLWQVLVDHEQIEQVILNLALNARDAMPRGGRLRIETLNSTGEWEGQERAGAEAVVLRVSDNGSGIAEDSLPHIFEPFYSTKGAEHGSGLGLAICQGIVAQAGGAIRVSSRMGEGATFEVVLPRAPDVTSLSFARRGYR